MATHYLRWTNQGSGTIGSPPFVNVHHFEVEGEDLQTAVDGIADAFAALFTAIKAGMPSVVTWRIGQQVVDQDTKLQYLPSVDHSIVGGDSDALAPQLCDCVTWQTGIATRWARGRTYFGPLGSSVADTNGLILASFQVTLQGAIDDFMDDITALGNVRFVVYSAAKQEWTLITGRRTHTIFKTQRRRIQR